LQKATINDVAKYAEVSKKTVSRVLNNEPNVSNKTRQKVKNAFEKLSYKPSPQARGLACKQSFLIGLLYFNPNTSYVNDIQNGALKVCNEAGYHLIIHQEDNNNTDLLNDLHNFVSQSQLDGLVLTPPFSDNLDLLKMLNEHSIPYVRIAPTTSLSVSPCVTNNDEQTAYDMTQYLINLGHMKVGFIKGHPEHNASEQRLSGYKRALEENHIGLDKNYLTQGFFDFKSGEKCARQLLSLDVPPTAIFASNDYMAAGVFKVASQRNLSVPHDLSIAGFDDASISRHIWPSLTTIQQPVQELSSNAVELLLNVIRNKSSENKLVQLHSNLIIRESCAPPKAMKA